ncbi:MAG TPA: iron-containing alcohol dehydrogenase [Bacilli bacterium]|nr:iron-containing alcohol dehydrogenase [Bacilli bacterium]
MIPFEFSLKTKVFFGKDTEKRTGEIVASFGLKKVLLHYGQGSVVKTGLLDRVKKSLMEAGIEICELGGAKPNPEIGLVRELRQLARDQQVEAIIAIGGGSAIDSAKYAAASFYYEGDPFDLGTRKHIPEKGLPVGVILTIAAAGSEMSTSAVVTEPNTKTKQGFNSHLNQPLFSIMNPELTYTVSKYQTAIGVVDMMMHTLERYFMPSAPLEFADYMAESLLRAVMEAGPIALKEPENYDARATLMVASSWAHNGLTSIGKPVAMPVHMLEHVVSGLYPDVLHGAGLSVLFPAWALYYYAFDVEKFDRFARKVMDVHLSDKLENARTGILKLKAFFGSLGMPLTLTELGIENPDIEWMVQKLTKGGTRVVDHFVKPLDQDVAKAIYESCR